MTNFVVGGNIALLLAVAVAAASNQRQNIICCCMCRMALAKSTSNLSDNNWLKTCARGARDLNIS